MAVLLDLVLVLDPTAVHPRTVVQYGTGTRTVHLYYM
jgi:hypothetical protein